MPMPRPLVLVHGYSADDQAFHPVREALLATAKAQKIDLIDIDVCNYISLNNEITIKDIAEGFDRALGLRDGLSNGEEFDAIVHSTGMLVVRAWLVNYGGPLSENKRLSRLKHLIGLAPATWGSPTAHKGRTWLGALVKGNRELGPDFLNAGDRVLEGLELGSEFTWELAHEDLLGEQPYYGRDNNTPYVTVFIGNAPYTGLSSFANSPGSDGTVRWAGCSLNTRKITVDLTRTGVDNQRVKMSEWAVGRLDVPILAVDGRNHATILSDPDPTMISLVLKFLAVGSEKEYTAWLPEAQAFSAKALPQMLKNPGPGGLLGATQDFVKKLEGEPTEPAIEGWQQFIVHACDEWGDGISDYIMEVHREVNGKWEKFDQISTDVHAYGPDQSYRCFHIRLPKGLSQPDQKLCVCVNASTGTELMAYRAYGTKTIELGADNDPIELDISGLGPTGKETLFYPFTTTMIEIMINREPVPFHKESRVLNFEK
jgi:pimeloyl-ACP methyl ester carboxylesterase